MGTIKGPHCFDGAFVFLCKSAYMLIFDKVHYLSQKENWCKNIVPYLLVVIDVDEEGYREVIGAAEGMKEDKES